MPQREEAWTICRRKDGSLTLGPRFVGSAHAVSITPTCPKGATPVGLLHTHPSGNPCPSMADIDAIRTLGLDMVCVRARGRTHCYGAP